MPCSHGSSCTREEYGGMLLKKKTRKRNTSALFQSWKRWVSERIQNQGVHGVLMSTAMCQLMYSLGSSYQGRPRNPHTQDVLLVSFATSKPLHFELVGKMNASFEWYTFSKGGTLPKHSFQGWSVNFWIFCRGTWPFGGDAALSSQGPCFG